MENKLLFELQANHQTNQNTPETNTTNTKINKYTNHSNKYYFEELSINYQILSICNLSYFQ